MITVTITEDGQFLDEIEFDDADVITCHGALENVHVVYRIVDGEPVPRARRYIRATDSFEVVDPSTLYLGEED
jgi:hypothetical protein